MTEQSFTERRDLAKTQIALLYTTYGFDAVLAAMVDIVRKHVTRIATADVDITELAEEAR